MLGSVDFYQEFEEPVVVGAQVFDRWPGVGYRALDMDELVTRESGGSLRFTATVNSDGTEELIQDTGGGSSSDVAAE